MGIDCHPEMNGPPVCSLAWARFSSCCQREQRNEVLEVGGMAAVLRFITLRNLMRRFVFVIDGELAVQSGGAAAPDLLYMDDFAYFPPDDSHR